MKKSLLAERIRKHEYKQASWAYLGLVTGAGGGLLGTVGLVQVFVSKEYLLCGLGAEMGVFAAACLAFAAYHGEKVKRDTAKLSADGVAEHFPDELDGLP